MPAPRHLPLPDRRPSVLWALASGLGLVVLLVVTGCGAAAAAPSSSPAHHTHHARVPHSSTSSLGPPASSASAPPPATSSPPARALPVLTNADWSAVTADPQSAVGRSVQLTGQFVRLISGTSPALASVFLDPPDDTENVAVEFPASFVPPTEAYVEFAGTISKGGDVHQCLRRHG